VAGSILVALVIWGSLMRNPPQVELPIPQFDKLEHFGAYLLMTAWFAAAYPGRKRGLWIAAAFIALGGLIEILQGLSGYRDAEWLDWAADCLGVAAAFWYPRRWLTHLRARLTVHAPDA
jgi:VanZ family protein